MPISPEKEPRPQIPEGVVERQEEFPEIVEKSGARRTPAQLKAQVTDDKGKQMIQTPQAQSITIQLPATQKQLFDWSHGSITSSLTWFANFWLRLIKKAIHYGWKIIGRGGSP